ncbi:MAG: fibrobacter succinogenes major paralogous domain-containing protein [Prevotellaceae bacterium]|jgi:uncharacterized protein (TIGR02145 family)|nr:fibrobacter succinogenes major paralogous domain-containing protein [Prevotellaceae bacterium]
MFKVQLNLRKVVAVAICLAGGATIFAQEESAQKETGVKIGETTWATCNVGDKGEFVTKPSESGGRYTWESAQNVCPAGWRLPNVAEIEDLLKNPSQQVTKDGVLGREFGKTPNTIFLPETGNVNIKTPFSPNGEISKNPNDNNHSRSKFGYYWSSEKASMGKANYLYFAGKYARRTTYSRTAYLAVRCVAE